jgi:hypothetical protein
LPRMSLDVYRQFAHFIVVPLPNRQQRASGRYIRSAKRLQR